jgi:hypothetical protein
MKVKNFWASPQERERPTFGVDPVDIEGVSRQSLFAVQCYKQSPGVVVGPESRSALFKWLPAEALQLENTILDVED